MYIYNKIKQWGGFANTDNLLPISRARPRVGRKYCANIH